MVDFIYTERVEQRKRAINEVNKKWGLNIKLIELYNINQKEESDLKVEETRRLAIAENVVDKGGSNND